MNDKNQVQKSDVLSLDLINKEINLQLTDENTQKVLLATTFKGLTFQSMKQAMMEGMYRGFSFKDFLEKKIYAVPFGQGYSLVTSIDYSRSVGMKSGIVGKNAPVYELDDKGNIVSCTVTVKRKIGTYVGDFTATVYFKEYTTGRGLWTTKPRTMIAKVAEMHALRMACPEELSQSYIEEEMDENIKMGDLVDSSNLTMGKFKNDKNSKEEVQVEPEDTSVIEGEIIN
jgi:hypothetical protein